ncbi:uncharacterized protein LOC126789202 [Argentina anserina]|uniref:uncharacterized protein LOC126789202 n=1 Tax=Argentina anserina TaxID=57926 RepID=UPI0021768851|nr:uncharacterized protein LOC126789202 [Potentilla anserina]
MLEKIGLPAKPSLRGNNWVVDASHCQGCSSQFTFINRKHHCRRCGGIFCGSCTQQRMFLRGQGDSPVRICEPCKKLEEAARFERYGHKSRAARGTSKSTSKPEDEILNQILGNEGKDSGQEVNNNVVSGVQRATSSASCSNSREDSTHDAVGEILRSVSADKFSHLQSDSESATPEELRQQAVDEKKKYRILKGEGKSAEALTAFKKGKELERQADALEISLRKKRKKDLLSDNVAEGQIKDDPSLSGRRNRLTPPLGKEKDDLSAELKELGWSDKDLHDGDKKNPSLSLEGELSSLLREVSQNSNKSKATSAIDKTQVVAHKKLALQLKREGRLAEAKEELKRAKVLEKQLEEQELLAEAEESDDEISALIRGMDDDKEEFSIKYEQEDGLNFASLINAADDHNIDSNFEVTDEDMEDPEITAALESFGWTKDSNNPPETSAAQIALVDREALLSEIQSLKREALTHKRAGNVTEAMAQLKKAKLLERDLENIQSQRGNVMKPSATVHNQTIERSSKPSIMGAGNVSAMNKSKSKSMIQKELLALKKKARALRQEGRLDEAEEELKKGRVLENQLEEVENSKDSVLEHRHANDSAILSVADEEGDNVTDQDMYDPTYLSMLKNLGWNDDNEVANSSPEPYKLIDNMQASGSPQAQAPSHFPVRGSRKSKSEIQKELLGLKRKALALRRQGDTEEAEEMLKKAKALEGELAEMEAPKKVELEVGRDKGNFIDPLDSVKEEGDGVDVTENDMQDPALLSVLKSLGWEDEEHSVDASPLQSSSKVAAPRSKGEIQRELLDLKRKAHAFRRKGQTEEAEEVLKMTKVLEVQIEELEAPKGLPMELDPGHLDNQGSAQGTSQSSPAQSGNFADLLTGDDWRGTPGSDVTQHDNLTCSADSANVGTFQLRSSQEDLRKRDDAIFKKGEETVVANEKRHAEEANMVLRPPSEINESVIREEIMAFKRRALALKREGKLTEAREELKQAKVLEKRLEEESPQSKSTLSDVSSSAENVLPAAQKHHGSPSSGTKPLSSRDRFKLQQESLGHKRQALKLRREGRTDEAEAEFELAKALEAQLEESAAHDSTTAAPADDVAVEGLLDPEILSALRAIGIEDANTSSQGPGRPEHSKPSVSKIDNAIQDRSNLEEQIKAEKVKALHLKRAGKQAEALDALRRAKMLEKKLNSSPTK